MIPINFNICRYVKELYKYPGYVKIRIKIFFISRNIVLKYRIKNTERIGLNVNIPHFDPYI